MKSLKWLVPLLVVLVALGWGAIALAQDPVVNDPAAAIYIDSQPHTIAANGAQWFRFNYGGGNSLVTVTLLNGAGGPLRFNVFTPAQVTDWTNATPIGRGTVLAVNCNSGLPAPGGGCEGNDLAWGGKFHDGGTYYVQMLNDSPLPQTFTLSVAGEDVAQCVPPGQATGTNSTAPVCAAAPANATAGATPASGVNTPTATLTLTRTVTVAATAAGVISGTATATATATATPTLTGSAVDVSAPNTVYTDPLHGLPLSGQMQTVPGNASIWYRFEYSGDASPIVLRMENGALNGLEYALYTPEQAPDWSNNSPIGRGTATACTTEAQDPGACGDNVNALLWSGNFKAPGTYFVRVTNPTPNPVQFLLTVSGTGVTICPPSGTVPQHLQGTGFIPCPAPVLPTGTPTAPVPPTVPRPAPTETAAG